jgi:hypothetical protein
MTFGASNDSGSNKTFGNGVSEAADDILGIFSTITLGELL